MSVARSYAQALFEVANQSGETAIQSVESAVFGFSDAVKSSELLGRVLMAPTVTLSAKKAIVEDLCQSLGAPALVIRFLLIVVEKNRMSELPGLCAAWLEVKNNSKGKVMGAVYSAEALSSSQLEEIRKAISSVQKTEVELRPSLDPSLIGGVKVVVRGTTYDGTLKTQLKRLKESLVSKVTL